MSGRLERAWAALWDPSSPHFAPRAVAAAMARLAIGDVAAVPLFRTDGGENVEITLRGGELESLAEIRGHEIRVTPRTVEAALSFPSLTLAGRYELAGAYTPRGGIEAAMRAAMPDSGTNPPALYMTQARQNQTTLLTTTNGQTLVGTYYDDTDALNTILSGSNPFTLKWPEGAPDNGKTSSFMTITSNAAANPGDSNYTVGDDAYWTQAVYMRTLLTATAQTYANNATDPTPYNDLISDITNFACYTNQNGTSPMTVNQVYDAVNNASSTCTPGPETPVMIRAREMAERDYPILEAQAAEIRARERAAERRHSSEGRFRCRFAIDRAVLRGTLKDGIAFTALDAVVPLPALELEDGDEPPFTRAAKERLAEAEWLRRLLAARIAARLNGALLDPLNTAFRNAAAAERGNPAVIRRTS